MPDAVELQTIGAEIAVSLEDSFLKVKVGLTSQAFTRESRCLIIRRLFLLWISSSSSFG